MTQKPFGSGYFGEWIEDEFGLPAYRYTCNQLIDPKAVSPVNEMWRGKTDHMHQVGNDRLVGVASNFGHVQVRQDEGGPKFLNDHDPTNGVLAGGFGYLTNGKIILSTYYPGNGESFERIFGMGYFQKIVSGNGLKVNQVIFAPFGDDPLLISQITISNNCSAPETLRWVEYWGCQIYQFSYKSFILGLVNKKITVPALRRRLNDNFENNFAPISNQGILATKHFKGIAVKNKLQWMIFNFFMATLFKKVSGGSVKVPVKEAALEDFAPPPTFLVSLDAPADGLSTNPAIFFGNDNIQSPVGIKTPFPAAIEPTTKIGGLFIERDLQLQPGESRTIYFAYGYLPSGFDLNALIRKYSTSLPDLFPSSSKKWKDTRISLNGTGIDWIYRELQWHNYYLRSNLTYDSFFKEHILSQGHVYQYLIGFQGAARDPLQHALPFIYTNPVIAKEVIRYTLKEVKPDGTIPYGICGSGIIQPSPFAPSDLELWLLWAASELVLATRDLAFLDEEIPSYPVYGPKSRKVKVKEILLTCYSHFVNVTGTGKHCLQRLSNGDWNDGVVHGNVPPKKIKDVKKQGESLLNSAMATYVLDLFAGLLSYAGDAVAARDIRVKVDALRDAVRAQWGGQWFKRAWLSTELGWIGEQELWLEPQPWAIIGGAATTEEAETLRQVIDKELRQPSKIGATLINKPIRKASEAPGMGTSAGIWPSINGTLIWALARVDGTMAWDEWQKNSLAKHADAYPNVWYGIWSGPDTYNSHFSQYPGQTVFTPPEIEGKSAWTGRVRMYWTDFPVMNMHPHAWALYSLVKLMGIEFTEKGLIYAPKIPLKEYDFSSPLVGLKRLMGGYSGWYNPRVPGTWQVTILLTTDEITRVISLEINGKTQTFSRNETSLLFTGDSSQQQALQWNLQIAKKEG